MLFWDDLSGPVALRLALATFFVFALGYLTPFVLRIPTNVIIPSEILARTNPNMAELLDLHWFDRFRVVDGSSQNILQYWPVIP